MNKFLSSGWLVSLTFALLFCGYPLVSFLPEFLALPDRAASIGFRALCLSLCLLLIFLGRAQLRQQRAGFLVILGFWGVYLMRIIYDYQFARIPGPLEFNEFLAYTYGISFSGMLAMFVVRDWSKLRHAPFICIGLCGATCLLAIRFGVDISQIESVGRLTANERLNPITLGHTATTLIVSSMWYLFHRSQNVVGEEINALSLQQAGFTSLFSRLLKIARIPLAIAVIVVGLYALGLSASRSPSIALAFCLGLLAIWLRGRLVYLAVLSVAAMVLFIQLGLWSSIFSLGADVDRLSSFGLKDEDYGGGRADLYAEAWDKFTSAPLFGSSLFLQNGSYPHNLFLEALMATGILGGICLLLIFFRSFRNLVVLAKGNHLVFWLLLLGMQALTGTMTSGAIYYDPMIWTMLGVGLGLVSVHLNKVHRGLLPTTTPLRPAQRMA